MTRCSTKCLFEVRKKLKLNVFVFILSSRKTKTRKLYYLCRKYNRIEVGNNRNNESQIKVLSNLIS